MIRNFISKALVLAILSALFLALLSGFASAGCCITPGGCSPAATSASCTAVPSEYDPNDCNVVGKCTLGCCCSSGQTTGVGSIMTYCSSPPNTFVAFLVEPGEPCACVESAVFTISGAVADTTGQPLSGATVSAGGKYNYTNQYGRYSLANVTAGPNVRVAAVTSGCTENSVYTNLDRDTSDVNIILNCVCSPGTCNVAENAFCNTTSSTWHFFDLSIQSQISAYCAWCGIYDLDDCPQQGICISGDGFCPLGCSFEEEGDSDCPCVDCHAIIASCGDGRIDYPYETCDSGPYGQGPNDGQLSRCSPADCPIPGSPGACNCLVASTCGNMQIDYGEQCELGMLCSNGVPCNENCLCGAFSCNGTRINPSIASGYDVSGRRIIVTWTPFSSCLPFIYRYALFRCENSTNEPKNCGLKSENFVFFSYYEPFIQSIYDSNIYQDSGYYYYVQAFYGDSLAGTVGESNITGQKTGSSICMEPHTLEFCLDNARYTCNANNVLTPIAGGNCEAQGRHCMGPDRDGRTNCTSQDVCDQCNGLYGMFSNLDLRVIFETDPFWCIPQSMREVIPGCYFDMTQTLFSEFKYCADISSCYDYKSQQACEDPDDPCGKNKNCEWAWMFGGDNNVAPLNGIFGGMCRPNSTSLQRCNLCDDPRYNWLSSACNPQTCELFGDCFYQGESMTNPYASTCTSLSTFNCLNYNTPQDCAGGRPVSVNAIYNSTGGRIGGTHILVRSNDALGLGKCYWDYANMICRRNADNYPQNNDYGSSLAFGFDCGRQDTYCEADFTSPITTILPTTYGAYPANMRLRYTVADNYPISSIYTYFCINASGPCYPNELPTAIGNYTKMMTQSGEYNLYYYSRDPAMNLEQVKSIRITVDAERPFIIITNPATVDTFPTNQQNVTITGLTSVDTKWLCVNNTVTRRMSCINSCTLTDQTEPCISNRTGIFSFNISVSNTALNNIIGTAQDFAGNIYQNTLLGILLDIDPPPDANITIKAMGER